MTGYRIYRGGTAVGTTATTSYSDTGLTPSTLYSYKVTAYDAASNESGQSSAASATTLSAQAPPGQVLHLAMDEASGSLASDSSGNNNNGTLANGAAFAAGHTGNAVQFAQAASPVDIVTVPASPSLNSITNAMTVALWVYRTGNGSSPGGSNILLSRQIGTGSSEPFVLFYAVGNCCTPGMYFLVNTQNLGYSPLGTGVPVPLNEWHHWAATYDASQVKLYMDGVLEWAVNYPGGNLALELNNPFSIGGGFNTSNAAAEEPFVGKVDDLQLYNRALSAAEVQGLYDGSLPPPDTSAPSIPQELGATAISSTQINLSWSASTDNVGVAGYRVYRGGTAIGITTATSFSDTGLTASTLYTYTVTAYDALNNESNQSVPASATTFATPPPDTTAPSVPQGLAASASSTSTINLNWNASTDNVGVAGYRVYRGGTAIGTATATSYSDTGLTANTSYTLHGDGIRCIEQ